LTTPPNPNHLVLKEAPSAELLAQHASATSVRIVGSAFDLCALRDLPNVRELSLDDPRTLDGLETLKGLTALSLYYLPRIRSLDPIGTLENLEKLLISTPPGYDASRKCHEVESLSPLRGLKKLRKLVMRGILPDDRTLKPLHSLTQLETLEITHVYAFTLEDFARLAKALPNTTGHCLVPYFNASWAGVCSKCGTPRVALTAPAPRSPRLACPACHADRLRRHKERWSEIARL
jgi:hypothetical protein